MENKRGDDKFLFNKNKKAQGLSVSTIILIVLGIVVLVALILGFTVGWQGMKDWIYKSNNVGDVKSHCDVACTTGNKYSYCFEERELKTEDETLKEVSCYTLNKRKSQYGISGCPGISCEIYDSVGDASYECDEKKLDDETEVFYIGNDATINKAKCKDI